MLKHSVTKKCLVTNNSIVYRVKECKEYIVSSSLAVKYSFDLHLLDVDCENKKVEWMQNCTLPKGWCLRRLADSG